MRARLDGRARLARHARTLLPCRTAAAKSILPACPDQLVSQRPCLAALLPVHRTVVSSCSVAAFFSAAVCAMQDSERMLQLYNESAKTQPAHADKTNARVQRYTMLLRLLKVGACTACTACTCLLAWLLGCLLAWLLACLRACVLACSLVRAARLCARGVVRWLGWSKVGHLVLLAVVECCPKHLPKQMIFFADRSRCACPGCCRLLSPSTS